MANVKSIGDLSHDFETYIIDCERDGKTQEDGFVDELQAYHEKLNHQVEQLTNRDTVQQVETVEETNVVPIRPDIDASVTAVKVSQAAIEA